MKLQGAQGITAVGIGYKVIIRVINDIGSSSLLLFDDMVFKLSRVQCYTLIKLYGEDYDDYFPSDLNGIIGKKDAVDDLQTPLLKNAIVDDLQTPLSKIASSSKFRTGDNIPFNIEETLNSG
uniref:Replication protein A 70 kDa DNA-binding subunit B n=1 Tax=Tanacetum cinerariifolium TaxID=118510 RepID=A0A6L2MC43_TANCI|nr:replication protein A 70 kDa DNA-binding subunit B [Tanacetum cinerariifolium]